MSREERKQTGNWYAIKPAAKPGARGRGRRATFAVTQRTPEGRHQTLAHPDLAGLNASFAAGAITWEQAYDLARSLVHRLYKERNQLRPKRVFNTENRAHLKHFWEARYPASRVLVDRDTMWHDLKRAVDALGEMPLLTATVDELQNAVNTKFAGKPKKQRRVVSRLNEILKFHKRPDVQLQKAKETFDEVRHLTPSEFEQVARRVSDRTFRALCGVSMYSGMRLGEAAAIREKDVDVSWRFVRVWYQIDKENNRRETKTRTRRKAYLLPAARTYLRQWLALSDDERERVRLNIRHAPKFRAACRRGFPGKELKHCSFHDLRHSYAIALLNAGVSLPLVAQSLGNAVAVCERYYSGFVLTEEGIDAIDRVVRARSRSAKPRRTKTAAS